MLTGRILVAVLFAATCLSFRAAAQSPFAALSVVPSGRQVLDITTGITVLPDGGHVIDQQTGVRLEAEYIRYLDGSFIEATGVSVMGDFGLLSAASLRIDIPDASLNATGDLSLTRGELVLSAESMSYYAEDEVAEFSGAVTSNAPAFTAERALLDTLSGDVLLIGRYSFDGGFLTLVSPEEGGWLELRLRQIDEGVMYDATTDIGEDLLERFAARL